MSLLEHISFNLAQKTQILYGLTYIEKILEMNGDLD